jgi:hypothetical protein
MALTKIVVNCETGVTEEIELTPAEIAEIEEAQAVIDEAARVAEDDRIAALKVSAKAKLVAGTALTAEEASLLIG